MAAATEGVNTPRRDGVQFSDPAAAGAKIYVGTLVALDASGNAVPATAGGKAVRGVAEHDVDNTAGGVGDKVVSSRQTVYRFESSTLTRTDIGAIAYVADNQTVAKTGTAIAGLVVDVDINGAWVDVSAAARIAAILAAAA
jgi:hypothetical protein